MDDAEVISLRDYLLVLRRQRWIVLLVTVLVVVAALVVSFLQTPVYESETELVVDPVRRSQEADLEQLLRPQDAQVETERLVVTSRPVAELAVEELGLDSPRELLENIQVQAVPDTRVVRVVSQHPDPQAAAERADALASAYLEHRRSQAVNALLAGQEDVERRANELREQIDQLEGDGDDAEIELDEDGEPIGPVEGDSEDVERQILLAQLSQVMAQASELGEAADAITGGGSILSPAEVAESPVSPRPLRTGALAVVLGLLLGVGLAFLRDHIDDVVREEGDAKRATGNRPILGRIPVWEDPDGGNRLATVVEPASIAGESYRELSAGVRFLLVASDTRDPDGRSAGGRVPARTLLMASAMAGDGKTSTGANLAVAAARVGMRTLLVDADLRKPTVAARFGLGKTTGLTDLLVSGGHLRDYAVDVGIDNLRVLPAGTIPPNPHELLASPSMRAFEQEAREHADLVIYDAPAVLAVPDALELGHQVDHALLVARAGQTGRRGLASAVERLEQVGTSVAGVVLNGLDSKSDAYYYSYYYAEVPADQVGEDEIVSPRASDDGTRERDADGSSSEGTGRVRRVAAPSPAASPAATSDDDLQAPGGDAWKVDRPSEPQRSAPSWSPAPAGPTSSRTPWPPEPATDGASSTSWPPPPAGSDETPAGRPELADQEPEAVEPEAPESTDRGDAPLFGRYRRRS